VVFEWDENKREETLARRNLDFASVEYLDWDTAVYERSDRYSEVRYMATGYIFNRLHRVVYTIRDDRTRIISLRRANARERRRYAQT
jgi:uncharacterized DUF497 family protein